jgi:hypothetical protein
MKLTIDVTEHQVTAQLDAKTSEGRWNVPLVKAICRNAPCVTITYEGSPRFHYFRFNGSYPTVTFSLSHHADVYNENLLNGLVAESQRWLSDEIVRLMKIQDDIATLHAQKEDL